VVTRMRSGRPLKPGFGLTGMFRSPNSVIPPGTDHRKAMICGVEGPCVVTSPGCVGRELPHSSQNHA
jgi:hypothetical protein